jgi:DNA-binding PadR family transcriptional regulator
MSPRSSAPLTLEFILLGLLEERPMHGYDLFRALQGLDGLAMIWRVKQSMLYALLDKLEGQGFVEYKMLPGGAHPPRKDYHLTEAGRLAFREWRQAPVEHAHEMRQEFLARLYFARRQSAQSALDLAACQQERCLTWQARLQDECDGLGGEPNFARFVFSFRIQQVDGILAWLDQVQKELGQ